MSTDLTLTSEQIHEITGCIQPAAQLRELHRQGFWRARRDRIGRVVLERVHYDAVRLSDEPRFDFSTIIAPEQFNANSAKRAAAIVERTPAWADQGAIDAIYAEARRLTVQTGVPHHVDHEIPLQGTRVSGLHVETNLCVLPARENILKSNRFEVA